MPTCLESHGGLVSLALSGCELSSQSHRTQAPLSFPPHIIALGSLYMASLLLLESTQPSSLHHSPEQTGFATEFQIVDMLGKSGTWENKYAASAERVDGILFQR